MHKRRPTSAASCKDGAKRTPGQPRTVRSTAAAPAVHRPQPQREVVSQPCLGGGQPCANASAHKRRTESLRGWRVLRRGGSRARAHQLFSQCATSERPCGATALDGHLGRVSTHLQKAHTYHGRLARCKCLPAACHAELYLLPPRRASRTRAWWHSEVARRRRDGVAHQHRMPI